MREYKDQKRLERLERAAKAKQDILEKFRSRPAADDPAVLARAAERKATAQAREARQKERDERKRKEAEERAQREAIEKAEREARERREAVAKVIRDAAEAAERKAERDRRYAARKARQGPGVSPNRVQYKADAGLERTRALIVLRRGCEARFGPGCRAQNLSEPPRQP